MGPLDVERGFGHDVGVLGRAGLVDDLKAWRVRDVEIRVERVQIGFEGGVDSVFDDGDRLACTVPATVPLDVLKLIWLTP